MEPQLWQDQVWALFPQRSPSGLHRSSAPQSGPLTLLPRLLDSARVQTLFPPVPAAHPQSTASGLRSRKPSSPQTLRPVQAAPASPAQVAPPSSVHT